jgi:hypothetical protein
MGKRYKVRPSVLRDANLGDFDFDYAAFVAGLMLEKRLQKPDRDEAPAWGG